MSTQGDSAARRRRVVVGGASRAFELRHAPVDITLIDRRTFHLLEPLVNQVATGALTPGDIASPLRAVFERDNVRILLGEVTGFDLAHGRVVVEGSAAVPAPAGPPARHARSSGSASRP